jgi:hypothetical protein
MPAPYTGQFTVETSDDAATWTALTSYVIGASVKIGRQRLTDRFTPDICTIELLAPANSGPAIPPRGYYLQINGTNKLFNGIITDVRRDYGIPYASGTGAAPADRITITAESTALYWCGRGYASSVSITTAMDLITAGTDVFYDGVDALNSPTYYGTAFDTFISQNETFNGIVLDYLNSQAISVVGHITNRGFSPAPTLWANGERLDENYVNFKDTGSQSSGNYFYDQIEFLASDDNSYTEVRVAYNSAASNAVAQTGSQPFASYSTSSVLENLGDAQQTADVTLAVLSQAQYRPYRISTGSPLLGSADLPTKTNDYNLVGTACAVTFRGTTYNMVIEGYTITQDPEQARYTFYFSPALNAPLILDSTAFGILDTNTLGIG